MHRSTWRLFDELENDSKHIQLEINSNMGVKNAIQTFSRTCKQT